MGGLPLHPGVVHLPIGIAFALPLVALAVMFGHVRGWLPKQAWLIVVLLSALGLGTALYARETGEDEERRVAKVVGRKNIHEHEEAAGAFTVVLGVCTVLSGLLLLIKRERAFKVATAAMSLAFFMPATSGLRVGHLGGKLVFMHGAGSVPLDGSAPVAAPTPNAAAADAGALPAAPAKDDKDDDDDKD